MERGGFGKAEQVRQELPTPSSPTSYSHNGALRKQDLVGLVPFLSDLLSDMYMHYIVHYIALHSALQKTA